MKPRNTSRGKPQSCCFGLLAVIFLISLSYLTMSKTSMLRFSVGIFLLLSHIKVRNGRSLRFSQLAFSAVNSQLPPMTNGNTSDMASDVHPVTEDSSIRSQGLGMQTHHISLSFSFFFSPFKPMISKSSLVSAKLNSILFTAKPIFHQLKGSLYYLFLKYDTGKDSPLSLRNQFG